MRIELPYAHEIGVVPPGRRSPVPRWTIDRVTVDVPELSSSDCPVALRWADGSHWARSRTVRCHEGRLVSPFENSMGEVAAPSFRRIMLSAISNRSMPNDLASLFPDLDAPEAVSDLRISAVARPAPMTGRVVSDDAAARCGEAARIYAGSLVVLDGVVWWNHPEVEPTWRVTDVGGIPSVSVDVGRVRWNQCAFSADRRDDVSAHLRSVYPHRTVPESSVRATASDVEPAVLTDDVVHQARAMLDAVYWKDASDSADGPQPGLPSRRTPWKPDGRWCGSEVRQVSDALVAAAKAGVRDVPEAMRAIAAVTDFVDHFPSGPGRELTQTIRFIERVGTHVRRWREVEMPRREAAAMVTEDFRDLAL